MNYVNCLLKSQLPQFHLDRGLDINNRDLAGVISCAMLQPGMHGDYNNQFHVFKKVKEAVYNSGSEVVQNKVVPCIPKIWSRAPRLSSMF